MKKSWRHHVSSDKCVINFWSIVTFRKKKPEKASVPSANAATPEPIKHIANVKTVKMDLNVHDQEGKSVHFSLYFKNIIELKFNKHTSEPVRCDYMFTSKQWEGFKSVTENEKEQNNEINSNPDLGKSQILFDDKVDVTDIPHFLNHLLPKIKHGVMIYENLIDKTLFHNQTVDFEKIKHQLMDMFGFSLLESDKLTTYLFDNDSTKVKDSNLKQLK